MSSPLAPLNDLPAFVHFAEPPESCLLHSFHLWLLSIRGFVFWKLILPFQKKNLLIVCLSSMLGNSGRSHCGSAETNLTSIQEEPGFNPWPCSGSQGSGLAVSCGVGRRYSSDPELLRLQCRLAAAAPIQPLAWGPPCAKGETLKRQKQTKTKIRSKGTCCFYTKTQEGLEKN